MAREKHITDITIENFKCFSGFEVKNLGQFNLIVGDNNTGKTSFLEALFFDGENSVFDILRGLRFTLYYRTLNINILHKNGLIENAYQYFPMFLCQKNAETEELKIFIKTILKEEILSLKKFDAKNDLSLLSDLEKERFFASGKSQKEFIFDVNGKYTTTLQIIDNEQNYFPFIPFGLGYKDDLLEFYATHIDINIERRTKFIQNLKTFIPQVVDVRIGNDVINIYEENKNTPLPLYAYGEGANKLFRILCEIVKCHGKRLMIDEIDTGIHFSRFSQFWRTIMLVAIDYDVQIFATTHNEECLDYFRIVLEEEDMKSYQELARVVSLKVLENSNIKARVYNFEDLEYANETDRELRGGGI